MLFEQAVNLGAYLGLVAVRRIPAGAAIIEEEPIMILDPPCKRNEILKLLGKFLNQA